MNTVNLFTQEKETERARQMVERFVNRFDESYQLLAYYAALPLVLTPELVNYLRVEFLRGENIPWVAEVDLLLSDICHQVGYELYAMDTAVRAYLLEKMQQELSIDQMQEVAKSLISYVKYLVKTNPYISSKELQTQQWAAMVYLDNQREKAVSEITQAFKDAASINTSMEQSLVNRTEMARLAKIAQELAPQLSAYKNLVAYARLVAEVLNNGSDVDEEALRRSYQILPNVELTLPPEFVPGGEQSKSNFPPTYTSNFLFHNYALLIGVNESNIQNFSLPVVFKDIQALKSVLVDSDLCGYFDDDEHIRLLFGKEATKEKILHGLNWLEQKTANDPDATALIYYSGHGYLHKPTDEYYLIPYDITNSITTSALSAKTFQAALQQINAKKLLVILDCPHAGGMISSEDLEKGKEIAIFGSSTAQQQSWIRSDNQMSIYTYHFLEALQGAGNKPGDTMVRISDLMSHLSKTVPQTTQQEYQVEQSPYFSVGGEDFPVALLLGGKGLPPKGWEEVKSEAQEKIHSISVQLTNTGNITGHGNTNITIDNAGNINGNISSKHGQ